MKECQFMIDEAVIWETLLVQVRGVIIRQASLAKRNRCKKEEKLLEKIKHLEEKSIQTTIMPFSSMSLTPYKTNWLKSGMINYRGQKSGPELNGKKVEKSLPSISLYLYTLCRVPKPVH